MPSLHVHVDAAKTNRSLTGAAPTKRPEPRVNPVLKFWRWLINSAVADAKRTRNGLPTDAAILARWWIEEHKPDPSEREEWERSFACACSWLGDDPGKLRQRLLEEIDAEILQAYSAHVRSHAYVRRAAVLSCAGNAIAIGGNLVLPLVAAADYETCALIEFPDPPNWERKARPRAS